MQELTSFSLKRLTQPFLGLWDKTRKHGTMLNLHSRRWPTKITPTAYPPLTAEVVKETRTTSQALQASLALVRLRVLVSTIRKKMTKFQEKNKTMPTKENRKKQKSQIPNNILMFTEIWGSYYVNKTKVELFVHVLYISNIRRFHKTHCANIFS